MRFSEWIVWREGLQEPVPATTMDPAIVGNKDEPSGVPLYEKSRKRKNRRNFVTFGDVPPRSGFNGHVGGFGTP